jgi:hypothetical protein
VSSRCSWTINRYSGTTIAIGGIMYVASISSSAPRRPRNRSRANAYAPNTPTTSETATDPEATIRLFTNAARNTPAVLFAPPCRMLPYRENVMCCGIHRSGRASRSAGAATLEITSHTNGARITRITTAEDA